MGAIVFLALPAVLASNRRSFLEPVDEVSTILSLEDFIVTNHLLPLGSLVYLLFCVRRRGWGWDNFIREADTGNGVKFPKWARGFATYLLPLIVLYIFVQGYIVEFF